MRIENLGEDMMLIQGEAWEAMRDMSSNLFDALVTDPPYSSGGLHKGARTGKTSSKYQQTDREHLYPEFSGDNRDQRSFTYWMTLWLSESFRVLKDGAVAAVFTDWRQLPSTTDAFQAAGFTWRGVAVWDKTQGVRPSMGRYQAQAEYVVWGSKGELPRREGDKALPGVYRYYPKDKQHIAGKPVALMADLIKIVPEGGLVLDPFAGSGSTGVATLESGRRFVGIELTDSYFEIMLERLRKVKPCCETINSLPSV